MVALDSVIAKGNVIQVVEKNLDSLYVHPVDIGTF
jgi:hypothetical protein